MINLGIVVSKFNEEITSKMLIEAKKQAKRKGAKVMAVIQVPGAYEIPFAVQKLLKRKNIDSVSAIGAVIKGQTKHDEVIMNAICPKLLSLSLEYEKPVGLGISGPGINYTQAKARAKDYACRSVNAAVLMGRL